MKKMVMTLAFGVLMCAVSARTLTCLSGEGWTCDGEPVSVPHTWNATDACDGPGETAKLWTGAKGGDSVGGWFVGSHIGAFTGFAFEVTDFLKTDGADGVTVLADPKTGEVTVEVPLIVVRK